MNKRFYVSVATALLSISSSGNTSMGFDYAPRVWIKPVPPLPGQYDPSRPYDNPGLYSRRPAAPARSFAYPRPSNPGGRGDASWNNFHDYVMRQHGQEILEEQYRQALLEDRYLARVQAEQRGRYYASLRAPKAPPAPAPQPSELPAPRAAQVMSQNVVQSLPSAGGQDGSSSLYRPGTNPALAARYNPTHGTTSTVVPPAPSVKRWFQGKEIVSGLTGGAAVGGLSYGPAGAAIGACVGGVCGVATKIWRYWSPVPNSVSQTNPDSESDDD